ncbi:DUF5691 domain-containing protein [Nocardioides sp. C4-1]|uniref:DUF5691 domain-containing protein n=1 Tax=Nocardioides sp. C4-1 TaxID=3151851 RepID=UPI003267A741
MSAGETAGTWDDLVTASLVGTGRRTVPAWPPGLAVREGASPEERLLDAAAVGGALRRAGRVPARRADPLEQAGPDRRPAPPARAVQLLDLVLVQPPVGRRLLPALLRVWFDEAGRRGYRVHHGALPTLLTMATGDATLRPVVAPVLDERGRWLAGLRREWGWAAAGPLEPDDDPLDETSWARLPTPARVAALATRRHDDPARARDLLATTWASDPAPARAELLGIFAAGLSDDDEPFLEAALDDRSAKVREAARQLLDRLPTSARSRRLAALLRPLLSVDAGRVVVELPAAPDAAAVRDGLVPGPRGRSERAFWLGVLTRGAPLDVWTEATGLDAATVVATLDEPAASLELRQATLLRRDVAWARAHVAHGWEPALLVLLPGAERHDLVTARLARCTTMAELLQVVRLLDGPWTPSLSRDVVDRIRALLTSRNGPGPVDHGSLMEVLATRLHGDALPAVQSLAARDTPLHDPLHRVAHHLSLVPTILEAFA